jgi:hypothetical protein
MCLMNFRTILPSSVQAPAQAELVDPATHPQPPLSQFDPMLAILKSKLKGG